MLLTVHDSLLAWGRLGWYGHWLIGGVLLFFYSGGTRMLKRLQTARVKAAGGEKDKASQGNRSGSVTPDIQVLPPLDDVAKQLEKADFMTKK